MQSIFRKVILASAVGLQQRWQQTLQWRQPTVNVPFNFTVAGKTLPAGSYLVNHDSTGSFVTLESRIRRRASPGC